MSAATLTAIAMTAELTGTDLSKTALKALDADLSAYPEADVLQALHRCRKELKSRLTLSAVLERLVAVDGRVGAEEAWATALCAQDEAATVVWTDEIAQALAVARPLLDAHDKVAARLAFCQAYERLVREARDASAPCRWWVSLGHDPQRRKAALTAAIVAGRLTRAAVEPLLVTPAASDATSVAPVGAPVGDSDDATPLARVAEDDRKKAMRALERLQAHLAEWEARAAKHDAQGAADDRARPATVDAPEAVRFRPAKARTHGTASTRFSRCARGPDRDEGCTDANRSNHAGPPPARHPTRRHR